MADRLQVKEYVVFRLQQLSAENAHHRFEDMCREIAIARICSNILPATGPVSAGGDQGRDFETFVSYIQSSPIANSTFVGLVSSKVLAFICTIQSKNIITKIKSDIKTLTASGEPVEGVYCFSILNIPVSKRHKIEAWAKETYGIKLTIVDLQAIAEMLSNPDIFWVAQRYLDIPSDIYPRPVNEKSWYADRLEEWKKRIPVLTYSDLYEITSAAREAAFSKDLKQDLPIWMKLLESFINTPNDLKNKAIYEISVVSFRGLGTLIGFEEQIRYYFNNPTTDLGYLEDSSAFLNYVTTALWESRVNLSPDEIIEWRSKIIAIVEKMLSAQNHPNTKCALLELRGFLSLFFDPKKRSLPDPNETISFWMQVLDIAPDAPLFPLERFADRLVHFIKLVGEHPKFDILADRSDELVSKRHGNIKAGEKCKDRAIEFYKAGHKLKAINQLHHAKVKWFTDESLHGSILCMLLLSEWYRELGLIFAAKYYGLAAAYMSLRSNKSEVKRLISRGLLAAANSDYLGGSWHNFVKLADIWIKSFSYYSDPSNDKAKELDHMIYYLSTAAAITEKLDSELALLFINRIEDLKIDDWKTDYFPLAQSAWKKRDFIKTWQLLEAQLFDRPFNDIGAIRTYRWNELGTTWIVQSKNDFQTNAVVEYMIAVLQILLTDLANVDLCLLKTQANITIKVESVEEPALETVPSNDKRYWTILLPRSIDKTTESIQHFQSSILTIGTMILWELSLLPKEKFFEKIDACFKNGISMKVFVARPYDELYHEFAVNETSDRQIENQKVPKSDLPFNIPEVSQLAWVGGDGPTYSSNEAKELLKRRYEKIESLVTITLKEALKNQEFVGTIKRLKEKGWLDWQLLTAIWLICVDYRVRLNDYATSNNQIYDTLFSALMYDPETIQSSPVPAVEFSESRLLFQMHANMIHSIHIYGLEIHQKTPDFNAIFDFLKNRYRFVSDDITHKEFFNPSNL
jgi:hypothetical protein